MDSKTIVGCGDLGGTKFKLAFAERTPDGWTILARSEVPSGGNSSFQAMLERAHAAGNFPCALDQLQTFSLGAAGVCRNQVIHHEPYGVPMDVGAAGRTFGWQKILCLNDAEAQGYFLRLPECTTNARVVIGKDASVVNTEGGKLWVTIGTGTGVCQLLPNGTLLRTEAGNGALPTVWPSLLFPFYQFLEKKVHGQIETEPGEEVVFGTVFYYLPEVVGNSTLRLETVLSGSGLALCYEFFKEEPISARAVTTVLDKNEPTADLFALILGMALRDMIVNNFSTSGVFLYGGVIDRNPELVIQKNGRPRKAFLQGLYACATHRNWVQDVPIYIVSDPDAALKGALAAI